MDHEQEIHQRTCKYIFKKTPVNLISTQRNACQKIEITRFCITGWPISMAIAERLWGMTSYKLQVGV